MLPVHMTTVLETRLFGEDATLSVSVPWVAYWVAFLRVLVGSLFLHAGMDKFLAGQPFDAGWWLGGPGSEGILGPLMVWFGQNAPWFVNIMIPTGELLVGLGLVLGALTRLAAFSGSMLMFFLYFGNADWEHGFVNGDLLTLVLLVTLVVFGAGRVWGVDAHIERTGRVRDSRWLRYLLG